MKRTIKEWVEYYEEHTGKKLNIGTVRKRRAMAGIGELVPPRQYIMTYVEFLNILETPLPMCSQVIGR